MTDAVDLWADRLDEAAVRVHHGITPVQLAERYDVDDREGVVELTNQAAFAMIDNGHREIWLEELDQAAADLGAMA